MDANVRELAQMLNVDYNSLKDCCCDIRTGIARFSDQMGYRAEQIISAMERGNSGILQAVSNCLAIYSSLTVTITPATTAAA